MRIGGGMTAFCRLMSKFAGGREAVECTALNSEYATKWNLLRNPMHLISTSLPTDLDSALMHML
ncbi:MAG: hypothetical protein AB1925_26535 [Actinomycetota bacterium]